jgi:2-oxoglutarate ferredoxin oxidoreductase subunit beta
MVYGLTKGQASPTSRRGFETPVQVAGVYLEPFNPVAVAIAMGATFVARAFSGDSDETREIIKKAINHKGYALVDILHPCVSFNKVNNFRWYKDNTYYLDESWVAADRDKAMHNALDNSRLSLGVIYQGEENSVFEENIFPGKEKFEALYKRKTVKNELKKILDSKKV